MTIGNIKIAALKLMFETGEDKVTAQDLTSLYSDSSYSGLLYSMPESINRAIDRFIINGLIENDFNQEITVDTSDNENLNIPRPLANMIPHFIKAELYEDDEPSRANLARSVFENNLAEYLRKRPDIAKQDKIIMVL